MPSLKDIRKRISSVKNTQKITRALKLVSAAKLNRAQREMSQLKPYAEKQRELVQGLVGELGDSPSPLFEARSEIKTVAVLVICSDRGMCGAFNSSINRMLKRFSQERHDAGHNLVCFSLGRRAKQSVKKLGLELAQDLGEVLHPDLMNNVAHIAQNLIAQYEAGEFDQVYIMSNRFINAINQNPEARVFLPIAPIESTDDAHVAVDRIYEPDQQTLLDFVLPRALETQVRQAILESITGEHVARMNAMNSATDNASDMINNLTLALNRARQAAITKELMEIISGAEALK
jgi:F-type H+-transporting ATPase subunit gamma